MGDKNIPIWYAQDFAFQLPEVTHSDAVWISSTEFPQDLSHQGVDVLPQTSHQPPIPFGLTQLWRISYLQMIDDKLFTCYVHIYIYTFIDDRNDDLPVKILNCPQLHEITTSGSLGLRQPPVMWFNKLSTLTWRVEKSSIRNPTAKPTTSARLLRVHLLHNALLKKR